MRLSIAMIVRDERAQLATCLASAQGADEIVIVDTGSTDGTPEIARSMGATVYDGPEFAWRDDFAFSRNQAIDRCTGDWILMMDAKEHLEAGGLARLRAAIAEDAGAHETFFVWAHYEGTAARHIQARAFRNRPELRYVGAYHEVLSRVELDQQAAPLALTVWVGAGLSHARDPDRGIRIMERMIADDPAAVRERYYLAREYFYRADAARASALLDEYLARATWWPERLDAMLLQARCHWHQGEADAARALALEAVRQNPDFREALLFLADLYFEPWKHKWQRLAAAATNEDVLFVRC